jgi:hypothetical protein
MVSAGNMIPDFIFKYLIKSKEVKLVPLISLISQRLMRYLNPKRLSQLPIAMQILNMDVPDKVFSALRISPNEFTRKMRLMAAASWN